MKNIGGQAVIEGVMMKSRLGWTVAVRDPRGEVHLKREPLRELPRALRLPFLRGVVALYHALAIGIKALEFSASKAHDEEKEEKPISKAAITATIGFSILLGIVLFILVPLYATKLIALGLPSVDESSLMFNLADGLVRVLVFFLYVLLIGLWGEMRRVFEYHGAEHKVIHAYEAGRGLDINSAREFSTRHPRCGTSFLMIVMVISIIVFSLIPQPWTLLYKFLARVVLIPAIAGISFEILKLSAKMKDNPVVGMLVMPGIMLQRLTTREPDDGQLEVAVTALEEVLAMEDGEADAR
jgi:uncharacterized protein YqhQ